MLAAGPLATGRAASSVAGEPKSLGPEGIAKSSIEPTFTARGGGWALGRRWRSFSRGQERLARPTPRLNLLGLSLGYGSAVKVRGRSGSEGRSESEDAEREVKTREEGGRGKEGRAGWDPIIFRHLDRQSLEAG